MSDKSTEKITKSLNRRGFLSAAIYTLGSMIAGAIGVTSGLYLLVPPKTRKKTAWVDAGELPDLPIDVPQEVRFQRVRVDGWKILNQPDTAWVLKSADGNLTAFSPLCTHLGCAYQWAPTRRVFSCPCHGSTFSPTGEVITGPAARPLDRYEVKRVGENVWLGPMLNSSNV